jgi:diacylglycerol O-acyltransferase
VLWRELLVGLAVFGVYTAVAAVNWPGRRPSAVEHAGQIADLERFLHLDLERPLNSWLADHQLIRAIANYEYAFTYIISAFLLLGWLYLRQPVLYRWARSSFIVLNLIGIACFALYPLAPPRLMPGMGFIDTVAGGHTWGSWGSGFVDHANELAAMPSLHFAWALWVSVVLALISGTLRTQLVSGAHVLVTLFVILATANHYLFDALGGAVLVLGSTKIASLLSDRAGTNPWRERRVAAVDAFFLHVESPTAAQHVGGVVLLDLADSPNSAPSRDELEALVRSRLEYLPRFRQRLAWTSSWRRPRWVDAAEIDWNWHIAARDLWTPAGAPGGLDALGSLVGELEAVPLPRDRPLWRLIVAHGVTANRSAVILIVHHVVADGFGTVAQALHLLEPALPARPAGSTAGPGPIKTLVATAVGLAQLATEGRPREGLPVAEDPKRAFGMVTLPLAEVRVAAQSLGARVSDVLLCVVAGGLARVLDATSRPAIHELRTSVPLTVRAPEDAIEGNITGAVMLDLPLDLQPESERLAEIARRSGRLRNGTRALASRFVMNTVGELLPPIVHAQFSRTVYGRRYFHAIVSNMPGPDVQLSMAGLRLDRAFPMLPLAPGTGLAVGALGWTGQLCLGISAHPSLVADIGVLESAVTAAFAELRSAAADNRIAQQPAGP